MVEIRKTRVYTAWIKSRRDIRAVALVDIRIRRLSLGNAGDCKPVGEGVSELRIDYGPGYRVYFMQAGAEIILLLCAGDKTTQSRDIQKAIELAREFRNAA